MMTESLLNLSRNRRAPEDVLGELTATKHGASSKDAGLSLVHTAASYGLDLRNYLTLAVDPSLSKDDAQRNRWAAAELNGYEAALDFLGLPIKEDFSKGVVLEAAAETFQTFPGTRALFPQVMDDMVRWATRQDNIETIDPLILGSRSIDGTELISTVVDNTEADSQIAVEIEEGSRVPVKSIRTSENSIKIYKHGMGWRTTYEFNRRAKLDILTPYVNRAQREMERSKVLRATAMLVNGDGVQSAATVVAQSDFNAKAGVTATAGKISWPNFVAWLVSRAQAGVPVDTVVGNYDAYLQYLLFFGTPVAGQGYTGSDLASRSGMTLQTPALFRTPVSFAVSSTAPAGKLIGIVKNETLEEVVEAGSLISESEQSVLNQTVTYIRTENSGFRLPFGDTRSIYNFGA